MLYTVNRGNTGRPPGCQTNIVHLVTSVDAALKLGRAWAVSDVNAGAGYATFSNSLAALDDLDWGAIRATQWKGRQHVKAAEFLIADRFGWSSLTAIGTHNATIANQVRKIVSAQSAKPEIRIEPSWYY